MWKFVPFIGFLAEPVWGHQVPAIGVIMCNTASPAAPYMNAVTADARIVKVIVKVMVKVMVKIVAEFQDHRVVNPDLADAVFPKRAKDLNLRNLQIDTG